MATVEDKRWLRPINASADQRGTIHDPEAARKLGFKDALIGGSVITAYLTPALVDRWGTAWYERGFLKQAFVHPLYESDEFRVVIEEREPAVPGEELAEVAIETRDGNRTTAGYAGLASVGGGALAPWERPGEPPVADAPSEADDPLPHIPVGTEYEPITRVVTIEDSESRRQQTGDMLEWYTDRSPWGEPVAPSFMQILIGLGLGRELGARTDGNVGQRAVGMNGTWQLLHSGPMFVGQPYTISGRLVEKGRGTRSGFRTTEFEVTSADGEVITRARQKIRWLLQGAQARQAG